MTSQMVLQEIASGTGGFVIMNTNDLFAGLEKITAEQDEYYILGYTPEEAEPGACHALKVKVDRGGVTVRSRSGYCEQKPQDLLAGTPAGHDLESRANAPGNVTASMKLPFFYTAPNTARVNLAIEVSPGAIKFSKVKGKQHSEVNVLGIAYKTDGAVAARFSDTVNFDFDDKKQAEAFRATPWRYDTQFELASGQYTVKLVFSSGGGNVGKLEAPLVIDPYDSRKFGLSAIALSKEIRKVSDLDVGLDTALIENKTPLVSSGMELTPYGGVIFNKAAPAGVYVEVYDPLLADGKTPKVGVSLKIIDRKSGQQKLDTGYINMQQFVHAGNAVVPIVLRLPLDTLGPGDYRAEVSAVDSAGNEAPLRTAEFSVE